MALPLTRFSMLAVCTSGLDALYPGFQKSKDGIAAVTRFVASEGWQINPQVTTTWTNRYAAVTTTWTVIAP